MKRVMILSFAALLFLFCVLLGFQNQQELSKPLEYEVTVELVIVEVFVTDKKGNFVENLTKDDFEIYEDGKRVKIQYFAVVGAEEDIPRKEEIIEEIEAMKKPTPPQEMKLVILFDNINTNRFYLGSSWPRIQEMFKSLSGNVKETMIMEINRESGARIIQPFTSDQALLADKINNFWVDSWKEIEKDLNKKHIEFFKKEAQLRLADRFVGNPEYVMWCLGQEEKYIRRGRLTDSFSAFLAAVNYIRRFEGIKSVLLVSDGFHLEKDFVRIFDPFKVFGGKKYFDQREAFEKFLKLINEERLIFYAFSPQPSVKRMFDAGQWSRELYSLEKIAEETGGIYLRGEKKYENFVKELGRDLNHFYDISYAPPKKSKKGGYHRIEVRVKRPGLIVRHKKGYSDSTKEEVERKNIASAFLTPSFFEDIDFSCRTDFVSLRGGRPRFWIRMQIPLDQFRNVQDRTPPEKLAMMFGINEWTEKKVHFGEIEILIKEAIEGEAKSLYHAFTTSRVKLKPGEYDTRVILKHGIDRIGGWEARLKIPEIKKELPLSIINSILGFLKSEPKENKIPFYLYKRDGSLLLSRHRFYPSVESVFRKRGDIALFLQIYNPKKIQDFPLHFSLYKNEHISLDLPSQKIESYFDDKTKIFNEVYLFNFQDVPPGDYQFHIKSSEKQPGKGIKIKVIS